MYDVIIHGGGIAGATLALALAHSQPQLRLAIIERQLPHKHQQGGFDARCIALSQGSCQRLNRIRLTPQGASLWQAIEKIATPIQQIHVSDRGHAGLVQFSAQEFGLAALGAVVELSQVGQLLLQQLALLPQIDYFCPDEIIKLQISEQAIQVELKSGQPLSAKLLVGADGTYSKVAQLAGIESELLQDYQQTAIITNLQLQQAHQYQAFERFTEQGPIALLPLGHNRMTLVWCVKQAAPLLALDEAAFLAQLQQTFGWRLGKFLQCGKPSAYPLKLVKASQLIKPRLVLIGNASQTLHPIAGQGFNLGIRDVLALVDNINQSIQQGQDIGDFSRLQSYKTKRYADQQQIIQLTDGLVGIFANQLLPLAIGRNLGLFTLAQSSLLRQHFAKPTLGWI